MDKKILTLSAVVLLAIGGSTVYLLSSSADKAARQEMVGQEANSSTQSTPTATEQSTNSQPGAYIDYSPSAIADAAGTKLLFFHAPWCPQCRALESDIKSKGVPSGVTIIKVDYDTSQALRKKYGVTLQTTVVRIDDQGNLVSKLVAYNDPSLKALEEGLL